MTPTPPPSITVMNRLFWPRRFGGLESVLWQLTNALTDAGVRINVVTEHVDGSPNMEDARPGLSVFRHRPVEFGRLWRVGELVQVRWWIKALRTAPHTDYLWANEPTAAAAAILLGRAEDLIYRPVFCYAGMHHVSQTIPEMAGFARTRLARRLDRFAYRKAGLVIDESRNLQRQQQRRYGKRANTRVIPNATAAVHGFESATASREQLGLSPRHFVVGFVGRPGDPCKDLPFLIKAMTHRPLPDHARLLIVGGGDGLDRARQWVRDAGLDRHTIWTGNLEDTAPAYRAMDALVLPSRFETFGNVIIEAMAHGVPALGRRFNDLPTAPVYTASDELITHGRTGLTVHPHDPADLSAKLLTLIADPAQARAMGVKAARQQAAYPWATVVERYLEALGIEASVPLVTQRAAA